MATVGYTTIGSAGTAGGSSGATNFPSLMITMPIAGSITKITAYVSNDVNSGGTSCSLYTGSAGALGALQSSTNNSTVTTTPQWLDFTFASPFAASATTYWLQFNCDGGNGPGGNRGSVAYDTGGATNTGYQRLDNSIPSYNTLQYSIYATYTASDGFSIALK